MLDPMDAILALLRTDAALVALVGERMAVRHAFAIDDTPAAWPTPAAALQVQPDPGRPPDRSAPLQRLRLAARCYGESQRAAMAVYLALVAATRALGDQRRSVAVAGGAALVYHLGMDSGPRLDYDAIIKVDLVECALVTAVAELPPCP